MKVIFNLQTQLEARNISQREISRLTGIRQPTISNICNNKAEYVSVEHIALLCSVLECGISDLMTLTDNSNT